MQFLSELKDKSSKYNIYEDAAKYTWNKSYGKSFGNKLLDSLNPFLMRNDPENKLEDYSKDGATWGFDRFQRFTNAIVLACAVVAALLAISYLIPVMGPVAFGMSAGSAQTMTAGITTAIVGLGGVATFAAVPGAVKGLSTLITNTQPDVQKLTKKLTAYIRSEVEQTVEAIKSRKENGIRTTGSELDQLKSDISLTIKAKYSEKLGNIRTEALIKHLQEEATKDFEEFYVSKDVENISMTPGINAGVEKKLSDHIVDANQLIKDTKMDLSEAREVVSAMNKSVGGSNDLLVVKRSADTNKLEIFCRDKVDVSKKHTINCRPKQDQRQSSHRANEEQRRSSREQNNGFGFGSS